MGRNYSEAGLRLREIMKRRLKTAGVAVERDISTEDLRGLYRKTTGKPPPTYDKISLWLQANKVDRRKLMRRI